MNKGQIFLFALLASSTFVAGCGGGGHTAGKSKGTGVLSVTLDAEPGTSDGPTGTMETVVIYRTDGTEVDKKSVNLSSGTKQLDFSGIPAGTMRLHVGLTATSGGVEAGAVDTTFEGNTAATPVTVRMKRAVSGVVVSPTAGTVNVGATTPFYAAAKAADGSYIVTAASGWSWTSDATANATVDSSGKVAGVATGNASITATHVASSANGSSTVSVLPNGIYQGKWTVMVYMDAANDLWKFAADNINQMEQIASNPNVRFVIQWKQVKGIGGNTDPSFSGTRRYLAAADTTNTIKSTLVQDLGSGIDMADTAALRDFVAFSKAKYPADHYALVLWSHGGGWYSTKAQALTLKKRAIIYDEETDNYLAFPDVRSALDPNSLDILGYDACLMQSAESLLEFADRTKYIVGTEDDTPGAGYPYQLVFKPFVDAPDTSTATLATGMATAFVNTYDGRFDQANWPIQMSVLDTSKASQVASALDGLGTALLRGGSSTGTAVQSVRNGSYRIQKTAGYYYYDLDQLATGLAATSTNTSVQAAAIAVDAAIKSATITNSAGIETVKDKGGKILNSTAAPDYHGMSIEFGRSSVFSSYAGGYGKLQLSGLTHWNEFLASTTANP